MIIRLKLDVTKIDKGALFKGTKGTYLDATVLLRDETDQYGNNGIVVQDLGKERREAGEKGAILGNAKIVSQGKAAPAPRSPKSVTKEQFAAMEDDGDDIPF